METMSMDPISAERRLDMNIQSDGCPFKRWPDSAPGEYFQEG